MLLIQYIYKGIKMVIFDFVATGVSDDGDQVFLHFDSESLVFDIFYFWDE